MVISVTMVIVMSCCGFMVYSPTVVIVHRGSVGAAGNSVAIKGV